MRHSFLVGLLKATRAAALSIVFSAGSLVGCEAEPDPQGHDPQRKDAASESKQPRIASRACGRPDVAHELMPVAPRSSWECAHHDDCTEHPHGLCFVYNGQCRYSDAAIGNGCASDADCSDGTGGRCNFWDSLPPKCRYDACASNADCAADERCVCPALGGDPWCIQNGCDHDDDCKAPQTCRRDNSIQGVGPVEVCSTDADECHSDADCDGGLRCGYDGKVGHWLCRDVTIVD